MKKHKESDKVSVIFMQLGLLFTVCLIAANIFEAKEIVVGSITLTGGLLIFPLTYVICRAVCEVWGFQRASLIIWMGFLLNFLFMGVALLVDVIPGVASADEINQGFHAIFGLTPRITVASCVAFLAGSFVSSYVMSRRKQKTDKSKLAGRLALSSVMGEAADSLLFFPIATLGILSVKDMFIQMAFQFVLKTVYEIILIPAVAPTIKKLKKIEGDDAYKQDISYGIFDVFKR
ncbi:MAG: queuosine precursor transporter [Bacteroidales bacterium]|nr:queuosine precursor transporter [Bacteroidales bacterium]